MNFVDSIRLFLHVLFSATAAGVIIIGSCSRPSSTVDGGGTRGGNPVVTGTIIGTDGAKARNVRVSLLSEDYDPGIDAPPAGLAVDTTDERGTYTLTAPDSGRYNIEAVDNSGSARLLRFHVAAILDSTSVLPDDTLRNTGRLIVTIPEGNAAGTGYVYFPGTGIMAPFQESADSITLETVPAATLPVLYFALKNGAEQRALRYDIVVRPDETTVISNTSWAYSRRIVLNTSADGAGIRDDVYGFPVLIRLSIGNFDVTQALPGGADLMFTGRNGMVLAVEIERWDAAGGYAEVWVKADTIRGNDSTQSITMYWGNPDAVSQTTDGRVFGTADGHQGVWHLGDAAGGVVRDATVNGYDGISPDAARPQLAAGAIGACRLFDGVDDFVTMPNTASGRLNFPLDGNYTVSAWVRIDAFTDGEPQLIVSKGYEQYFLRSTYFPSAKPLWEFTAFDESAKWQSTRSPAEAGEWVLLAGVRQGALQRLYLNGEPVDSVKDAWFNNVSRDTTNDMSIGAFLRDADVPNNDGRCFLRGAIDEVRIRSVAESPAWIRLCYMNQRTDDQLVEFK